MIATIFLECGGTLLVLIGLRESFAISLIPSA
jgi:hypothetical protein